MPAPNILHPELLLKRGRDDSIRISLNGHHLLAAIHYYQVPVRSGKAAERDARGAGTVGVDRVTSIKGHRGMNCPAETKRPRTNNLTFHR